MRASIKTLGPSARGRFEAIGPNCHLLPLEITSLGDYLAILENYQTANEAFWFRGHADVTWRLAPSALRYRKQAQRESALALVFEFKRYAGHKVSNRPGDDEIVKWVQVARHYGLPTRLLDWTESAAIALYFACLRPTTDGAVFILDPIDLNKNVGTGSRRVFDIDHDRDLLESYLRLGGRRERRGNGLPTIAMKPVLNLERLQLQRGAFTLHGSSCFSLTKDQAPSLMGIPISGRAKQQLRRDLERMGIDEMSIFPEPEHVCRHLIRKAGLGN